MCNNIKILVFIVLGAFTSLTGLGQILKCDLDIPQSNYMRATVFDTNHNMTVLTLEDGINHIEVPLNYSIKVEGVSPYLLTATTKIVNNYTSSLYVYMGAAIIPANWSSDEIPLFQFELENTEE